MDQNRTVYALAFILLATHFLLAWLMRPEGVAIGHDDAQYLALAESLSSFSYRDIFLVGSPIHYMYPPGYPFLLLIWQTLFSGENFDLISLLGIICSTAALWLVFLILYKKFGTAVALVSLLLLSANPYLLEYAGSIMSEPPFLLFTLVSLYLLQSDSPGKQAYIWAALFAILAMLTRSIGIALLAAIGVQLLLARNIRGAILYAAATLPITIGWLLWSVAAPVKLQGRSYVADAALNMDAISPVSIFLDRIIHNIPLYLSQALPSVLAVPSVAGTLIDNLIFLMFLALGLTVGTVTVFRRWRIAILYAIFYGGVLVVWPWVISRFVVPIIPLILPTMLIGLRNFGGRSYARVGQILFCAMSLILIFGAIHVTVERLQPRLFLQRNPAHPSALFPQKQHSEGQKSFFDALDYIRENTKSSDIILSGKPATLFYHTRRQGISRFLAKSLSSEAFLRYLREQGVKYVLLGDVHNMEREEFGPLLKANCHEFSLKASFPPATYLLALKTTADDGLPNACKVLDVYLEAMKLKYGQTRHRQLVPG